MRPSLPVARLEPNSKRSCIIQVLCILSPQSRVKILIDNTFHLNLTRTILLLRNQQRQRKEQTDFGIIDTILRKRQPIYADVLPFTSLLEEQCPSS